MDAFSGAYGEYIMELSPTTEGHLHTYFTTEKYSAILILDINH